MDGTAPSDLAPQRSEMVDAAPSDLSPKRSEMVDAAPKYNMGEEQECRFCSIRCDEINRLLEENRKLKEELSRKMKDEDFIYFFKVTM